jgi:hypothetical protein
MNIGVYHIDAQTPDSEIGYLCAREMVKSAKARMPAVRIVHFTDLESPPIKGVDEVRRKPSEPMALLRMRHHAGVKGEWLFVDTDVIFQKPVHKVFREDFDIAVTTRNWPHLKVAVGFTERMPFNSGVMFSRCPAFWSEVYCRLRQSDRDLQEWMGDQEVICDLVTDPDTRYTFRHVKGSIYNFPPALPDDAVDSLALQADAAIVHYKGPRRKPLLLKRLKMESRVCA